LIIAAVNLRDEVLKSRDYIKSLDSLRLIAGHDDYIENRAAILEKSSKDGIATISRLRKEFYINAAKISKLHLQEKTDKNVLDKVLVRLANIVHVTKISASENSSKSEDIIARAMMAVDSGDISLAISEITNLAENDQKIYATWLDDSKNYVSAINAAEEILRYVIRPNLNNTDQSKS